MSTTNKYIGNEPPTEFLVYRRRFFICFVYALNSIVSAMIWISFAPIQSRSATYFNVSYNAINWLSVIFMVTYIPSSVFAVYSFQYFGLRKSFLLSSSIQFIGCIIRFIGTIFHLYPIVFIGQFLSSLSQTFFVNSPARIAVEWFSQNGRDLATALLSMANPFGIGIGSVSPTIFVNELNDGNDHLFGFNGLMFLQIIISLLAVIVTYIGFHDKPPTAPSLSQYLKETRSNDGSTDDMENSIKNSLKNNSVSENVSDLCLQFKLLLKDKQFMLLFCGFGIGLGLFNALTTLINQYTSSFGYSTDDAGLFGGLLIGGGLIGAIGAGVLMEITRSYRLILKIASALTFIFIVVFVWQLTANNLIGISIIFGLFGFGALPLVPLTFECAAECTYPLNEELSGGMLMSAGQIFGIIFILIWGHQLPQNHDQYKNQNNFSTYFMIIISFIMLIFLLLFNGEYKRLKASNNHQSVTIQITENNNNTNIIA